MRNIIRIGAGTDRRNRFVAIALGVALAAGPAAMLPAAALAAPATDAAAASTTAGATITLQGADGASLAGHTFNVYRIGTYTDQILNGTQISSLGVRGDTASNAWAADAIGIANAYDPDTADGKPVQGFDPTKTGTWTIPAGTQVNIVDMPDDWKLDGKAEQPAGTVVFTASKYGTPVVTWTFKNDSATDPDKPADPGTDALKNVAATADGKPIAGFDPTRDGAYKVRISDVPSDWKLDKTESGSKLVFTASKGGTAVTWTFEYQANGGSSATDPGNGGGSNAGGDGQGDPGKTPDTSKPAASPKPAGTADDGQAAGAAPLASTGAGTGTAIAVAGLLAMAGASLLAAVARTRRHGADPDGLTAD